MESVRLTRPADPNDAVALAKWRCSIDAPFFTLALDAHAPGRFTLTLTLKFAASACVPLVGRGTSPEDAALNLIEATGHALGLIAFTDPAGRLVPVVLKVAGGAAAASTIAGEPCDFRR